MAMMIKVIVGLLFLFIFFSLGSALFYLVRERKNSDQIVKALTWRIGLSVLLFVLLFIAYALGWISPHSLGG